MKGEVDETLVPQPEGGAEATEEGQAPLPGGKALLRILQILEREGLDRVAAETVDMAVAPENQGPLTDVLENLTTAPTGEAVATDTASAEARSVEGEAPPQDEELAQAYVDAVEQLGPPTATGPQWRSLGPWTIPNGQTYGSSRVNVSGRISSVAVDPGNPAHVLIGAASGGVWESFNRGASWTPRTDYQATLTVGALAFSRSAPGTVYCGSGEGDAFWWFGAGILRSTNGGATWAFDDAILCLAERMSGVPVGGMVFGMSNTVVTPPNAAAIVPLAKSSFCG